MLSTTAWENHVLAFDPFDGDFGDQGDRVLSNKLVTARKPGPCAHCGCQIAQGERVRSMSARFDGQLMSYRWCALCCEAMAKCDVGDDSGDDSEDAPAWQEYEARAAAEQQLRADQLAQQHRMQAQMHAQATQQLAELEARKPLPLSDDERLRLRSDVARAIWDVMREYEDRCDHALEDVEPKHQVWDCADAAIKAVHGIAGGSSCPKKT